MKKFNLLAILFVAFVAISFVSCGGESTATDAKTADANPAKINPANAKDRSAKPAEPVGPSTTMVFPETEFNFGTIETGDKVTHVYKFKNTGNEPLLISKAKGSCGCTVPTWPKEPIAPGAESEITVVFNSKGKSGAQSKRVTLTANTEPAQTFLTIKGEVKGDPKKAKPTPAKK